MKMKKSLITLLIVLAVGVLASPSMATITDLLVADYGYDFHSPPGTIRQYNAGTGAYVGDFTPAGTAIAATTLRWGPDGNLYAKAFLAAEYGDGSAGWGIKKYDGTSGALLGTVLAQPEWEINNFAFGPDGKLWTTEGNAAATSRVSRYELDGTPLGDFVPVESGLSVPSGLIWENDGNLLVLNKGSKNVKRYDTSGAYVDTFIASSGQGYDIAWGPDGHLYMAVNYDSAWPYSDLGVRKYNGLTGELLAQVVGPGQGGGPTPSGKYAGNGVNFINGNIAFAWEDARQVGEYQIDGTWVKNFGTPSTSGGELRYPLWTLGPTSYSQIPFIPAGDANLDGSVNELDAAILAVNWLVTEATWGMGDFDGDGVVNDVDATIMAANWGWMPPADNASVPEPSMPALFCAAAAVLALRRRIG